MLGIELGKNWEKDSTPLGMRRDEKQAKMGMEGALRRTHTANEVFQKFLE